MANPTLSIIIKALNQSSDDLAKVKSDIEGVDKAGDNASKKGVNAFGAGLSSLLTTAGIVAAGLTAVKVAFDKVYEAAREGADLEYSATRFDNLATSIGTVSDALLTDLRDATSGMVSDSELMASAADFMGLGLAKTHDEVVRLATVSGALGMNMNQLVLTLTNQTTMRFDALGVSVDGFDAKVKALKDSGMDANAAFTEAFLQQAEEQIGKVGSKADSSASSFDKLAAAQKNYSDAIKQSITPIGELWANLQLGKLTTDELRLKWIDLKSEAKDLGIDIGDLGKAFGSGGMVRNADDARNSIARLSQKIEAAKLPVVEAGEAVANYYEQMAQSAVIDDAIEKQSNFTEEIFGSIEQLEAYKEAMGKVSDLTGLTSNFGSIIGLAKSFDNSLKQIKEQEDIMANNPIGSEKYDEAKSKVDALKQSMTDLANQMVLDMFQATIAIGGVTEAEATAYFKMAEDMGIISEDAAIAATAAYTEAIETINGLRLDPKTLEVITDIDTSTVDQYFPPIKTMSIYQKIVSDPQTRAIGGMVYAGNPYNWQEYGYRGELLVPSANGYVLSRADAERAVSSAVNNSGGSVYGGPSADDIARAVRDAILTAGIM